MRKSGKHERRGNPATDRRPRLVGYEELSSRVVLSANPLAEPLAVAPPVELSTESLPETYKFDRGEFQAFSQAEGSLRSTFPLPSLPHTQFVSQVESIRSDPWQSGGFKPGGPAPELRLSANSFETLTADPLTSGHYETESARQLPRGASFLADDFGRGSATVYVPVTVSTAGGQTALALVGLGDLVNAILAAQAPQPRGGYEPHLEGDLGGNGAQGILGLGGGPGNKPVSPANQLGRIGLSGPDGNYSLSALLNNRGEVSSSNRNDSLSVLGRTDASVLPRVTTQTSAGETRRDDTPQSVAAARVEATPQPRTRESDGGLIELRSSRKWGPKLAPEDGDEGEARSDRQDWLEDWLDSDAWAEQLELLATPAEPIRPVPKPETPPVIDDRAAATDQALADTEGGLIELSAPHSRAMLGDVVPQEGAALAHGARGSLERQEVRMDSGVALYQAFELSTEVPRTEGTKALRAEQPRKLPEEDDRAASEEAAAARQPHSASLTTLGLLLAVPVVRRRKGEPWPRLPLVDKS